MRRVRSQVLWAVLAVGVVAVARGEPATYSNRWSVVLRKDRPVGLELPRAAVVKEEDPSGSTWRQSGEHPSSLLVARKDFESCFSRQGWQRTQVIPTATGHTRSELIVWEKQARQLVLFLAEDERGGCAFFLGEDAAKGP
jgi:hypothetical protein